MNVFDLQANEFRSRHIGPNKTDRKKMLETIGVSSINELIEKTVPSSIRIISAPDLPAPQNEYEYLQDLKKTAALNKVFKTYIGQGYYGTITPSVIQRNIFENPGWYTQYTPYQAEISQGRLESLLNFQTVVADLTALPFTNASLLDEATAAAEAMSMLFHHVNNKAGAPARPKFFVDTALFPQTIDVLITRSAPIGVELVLGAYEHADIDDSFFGAIVQYPDNNGSVNDYRNFINEVHAVNAYVVMATDLLALTLLAAPGELGADVAIGSAQRFGVPVGFGGPHAAFFATREEFKRNMPGRIIGVSIDAEGNRALRMALQTREQHIKREKATSNICTAQALLANMAAMYAVYHGPEKLQAIATRIAALAKKLSDGLNELGYINSNHYYFDTLKVKVNSASKIKSIAEAHEVNFRYFDEKHVGIAIDETTSQKDVLDILYIFAGASGHSGVSLTFSEDDLSDNIPGYAMRKSRFLTHPVFNTHHSESEMMRYIRLLENKDLSLITSMIALGSCTMKLNAATEMMPVSWPEFAHIHPFAPDCQAKGYTYITDALSRYLCAITGLDACSLQPNSGAQGEYAGLLTIRRYHAANGDEKRNVVLIPISAHGTNPASAVLAGMKVVVVKSDEEGHIDVADLKEKAVQYKDTLAALMVTYPSTHGVFEESIKEICAVIHNNGGQVYMDGANMNAQCGLTSPGTIGADICHLNLHKTFAIPHGGGGPGMGPICAKAHLAAYLPAHIKNYNGTIKENYSLLPEARGAVSAAPYGSASILLISYAYIKLLGGEGVKAATEYAILNANYMRARLQKYYDILYLGANGTCAHEFIVDLRPFKTSSGIEAEDVAKRLMDYGFHAPTMSFPVAGTIMIEPTESEDKAELDRFCEALISIYHEIKAIESGAAGKTDNPLKNAPHTMHTICADEWNHTYSRQEAAFPLSYITNNKFWPSVSRINNTYGDRNLICTCEPVESYMEAEKD
ncbi:aminomethyl-transferring glycine dehydrogenase [Agriterribacter sp.]|uniref:aminomethyl-transferring glycine dehydrogenase n=1 Tax=Agriterribacter sp. TaxID=2821509 RepID=UPI002B98A275|nr:aminomethyl-transferring glycine dehydrogenase [Agriterribacter sp.]HTN06385.1 aminomethyl-transferring glycine dehydrogenase [Agriterribacter sp.]